jgi:hypothetical protein
LLGQFRIFKGLRGLSAGVAALALGPASGFPASADECQCSNGNGSQWDAPYSVERLSNSEVRLKSADVNGRYSVQLTSLDAESDLQSGSLMAGETRRKSIALDANAKLGSQVSTEVHADTTEVRRDPGDSLRNLQTMGDSGTGSRALSNYRMATHLFNDRVFFSSSRQASTWTPLGEYGGDTRGLSEQFRFKALLLKSDLLKFSVDGAASRVDPNYWELTAKPSSDDLLARNRTTHQIRSNLNVSRFALSLLRRDSATLVADHAGDFKPRQTEWGSIASVGLSDLRSGSGSYIGDHVLFLLPDSIWASQNTGTLQTGPSAAAQTNIEKFTIGATRGWDTGDAFASYWRSAVGSGQPLTNAGYWGGHGLDVGGNLYFGTWLLYCDVSFYSADSVAPWSTTAESNVNGSLLVTWKPLYGPSLTAGLASYRYVYSMFDYGGFDVSNLERYELVADFSKMASAQLDWDIRFKLLASYRSDTHESQWHYTSYEDGLGRMFMGFRFDLPL